MITHLKILLTFLFVLLLCAPVAVATEMKSGEQVVLPADTIIEGNYFTAGDSVTISGTVNGDLYVAGGNVIIEGTVNGDILAAGGNITLRGDVTQDVRVAGGNIIITGTVGQNVTVLGGSVNVTDAAEIQGSIVAAGGSIQLFAPVPGSITVAGGNVEIGNEVGGDVFAAVGNMNITSKGSIAGDLTYYSEQELNLPQGATVSGEIIRKDYPQQPQLDEEQKENIKQAGRAAAFGSKVFNIIAAFIIGALLLRFFPKYVSHVNNRISSSMWKSMGFGFLLLVLMPILSILLLVTVVGIPLGILMMVAYFFTLYVAKIFVSLVLGRKVLGYFNIKYNDYIVLIMGLVLYLIITSIPLIGWLVTFIAVITGFGAIYMGKKDYYEEAKTKKMI